VLAPLARPPKARARRGDYPATAEQSIVAFVKQNDSATTQEIRKHWTSEGRPGVPDYVVSRMVKAGKLKRTPLGGKLGSRYSLAGGMTLSRKAIAARVAKPALSGKAGLTGPEFVLQFVREQKNPTTAEINARWKAAGRPGRANQMLGKLVDERKLHREAVKDGRGSHYTLR
jgi:hypothetical protein